MSSIKRPCLFLDRDGVINKELGNYVTHPDYFELNDAIVHLIKKANENDWKVIVITNQGGIGKGLYTHKILGEIHQKMLDILEANRCRIDAIYYCPHHPEFSGNCLCRKPNSLLLEKAMQEHHIDAKRSVFIGDNQRDMDAASLVGIRGILIPSNQLDHLPELFD